MKRAGKWMLALGIAGTMFLSGCGAGLGGGEGAASPPTAEEISSIFAGDFSAEAAVTIGISEEADDTLDLEAVVTRSEDCCSVEVTAPEHLEGLTFTIDSLSSGDLTVRYKGLEIKPDSMPASNLGGVLAGALDTLSSPEALTVSETESGWCVTGETEAGAFAVLLDNDTHYPVSLTLPDARVGCTFTSFEAMNVFRPDRVDSDMQPELEPSESSGEEESNAEPPASSESSSSSEGSAPESSSGSEPASSDTSE